MSRPRIRIHFSVDVLVVLAVAAMGLVAWFLYAAEDGSRWPPDRATLVFFVSVVGGTAAIYRLSRDVEQSRVDAAFRFMERWNQVDFQKKRDKIQTEEDARKLLLNFFEEVSLAIESGNADEETLRRYFRAVAIAAWRDNEKWIKQIRKKAEFAFVEMESMVERWKKKKPI